MKGTNNPMCRQDVAKRMSQTRSQRFQEDPLFRKLVSDYTRQAWADGKYDGVKTGMCKWYDHVKLDGSIVKCQGTWEVALARRLNELNIDFVTHRGRWSYITDDKSSHSYYPDFYVPMWDTYIDVKGAFWNTEQAEKLTYVIASNTDKMLIVANRDTLCSWHVKLKETQDELLAYK